MEISLLLKEFEDKGRFEDTFENDESSESDSEIDEGKFWWF